MMKFKTFNLKNSLAIKRVLITFFLLTALFSCNEKSQQASFARIIERGYVSVGTLYGPNSFYLQGNDIQGSHLKNSHLQSNDIQGNTYAGFEYELAKKYADYLNVDLKIVPSYSLDELFIKLNTGEVDLLAAGLSVTSKRLSRFRFAPSYEKVS